MILLKCPENIGYCREEYFQISQSDETDLLIFRFGVMLLSREI